MQMLADGEADADRLVQMLTDGGEAHSHECSEEEDADLKSETAHMHMFLCILAVQLLFVHFYLHSC